MLFASRPERRPRASVQAVVNEPHQPPVSPRDSPRRTFVSLRRHRAQPAPSPAHETHRPRGARRPQALPGHYTSPFSGPVQGVAIIGCEQHRTAEEQAAERALMDDLADMLELVPPHRAGAPVSPNTAQPPSWTSHDELPSRVFPKQSNQAAVHSSEDSEDEDEDDDEVATAAPEEQAPVDAPQRESDADIVTPEHEENAEPIFSATGRGSVMSRRGTSVMTVPSDRLDEITTAAPASAVSPATTAPRNVLNHSYIVVTDAFATAHPEFAAAQLVSEFSRNYSDKDATLHVDPSRSVHRQKQMEVNHYVALAEDEYRPLFRRRASSLVYGRAMYLPASADTISA